MRQKISYDSGDYAGSVIIWILLIACVFFFIFWTPGWNSYDTYGNTVDTYNNAYNGGWGWSWWWWIILGFLAFWWICTLFYAPMDVSADDDEVRIRRPFKTRRIRMDEIESASPYDVKGSKGGKKFFRTSPVNAFGKWGHYHDDNIGDYFAYYGKPDNTVLIKLKDGRQYVVGGSNSQELADYINSKKK